MKKAFQLECADIQESWSGRRGNLRGSTIVLRHGPTGIEAKADVPMGRYTNNQIHAAEAVLRERLMKDLTDLVAKHLRIPGR